uniref:Helicase ATP-binding domain-containing protein n=1 Tax=viral metagenome TaxID=1070528 RepID=A0A6C0J856_9ZZZZ
MPNNNNEYTYPEPEDEDFQLKILKKREFYYHKIPYRDKLETYSEIKKYRDEICTPPTFTLREQQILLANFLSPETPYKGLLIMHGTGTGKTCSAIAIAEQFKEQTIKYNTKIYVLTSGPNIRENFKSELLTCTGETYLRNKDIIEQLTKEEKDMERKIATFSSLQYYKIFSYKTFYKKVLGEKMAEKKLVDDKKIKTTYRKNEAGDFERELVVDKITNMDNSVIIVDEAHNLTGNEYGDALTKIIKKSKNLKVILLTATPMKNLGDDIIDILNFLRPQNDPIKRDKIFTNDKNYLMDFKPNGEEYLRKKALGYVSFYRGSAPYTFAKRIDKGEIPEELLFTPLIRCYMRDFQLKAYSKIKIDSLDRASSSASNFIYPGLSSENKLIGRYSADGLIKSISQLSTKRKEIINNINKEIFKGKIEKDDLENFIIETSDKNMGGRYLNIKYLEHFSIKFYKCIKKLSKLVEGKKGSSTAFIYSNLVKAGGMELFAEALRENGYLDYNENPNEYNIEDNTIDFKTGKTFSQFKKEKLNNFKPATFIIVTGASEDGTEDIPEIKQKIIREVFNNPENKDGRSLKLILGSRVMTEGITLENVRQVHILDVHFNLGKVDQVIGRAIRMCKHQAVITDDYKFPQVDVYRYVASIENKLSSDETLYQKGEKKFILVKKIERIIKEVAIDCPILLNGNKFPEEIEKYNNCVEPTLENKKKGKQICPALCDFQNCDYKCKNIKLDKYYDNKKKTYKDLDVSEIDYTTFNINFAKSEIDNIKSKIKDLYRFKHIYTYDEIKDMIKLSYKDYQKDLFDEYFLDTALNYMIPKSENDYNNFSDTIFDKFNRIGYLIQREQFYIFQPFDDNENIPLSYRQNYKIDNENLIPIKNYFIQKYGDKETSVDENNIDNDEKVKYKTYDFESVRYYYDNRKENFIVGIIDKNNLDKNIRDIFKIRPPIKKSDIKRGTGIYSLTGSVCATSKSKKYLQDILNKLIKIIPNIKSNKLKIRSDMCNQIKNNLLYLEKYSTTSQNNKINYMIIPKDHPEFPFPYNLEDRVKNIIKKIKNIINREFDYQIKKSSEGIFKELNIKNTRVYKIEIKKDKNIDKILKDLEKIGFTYNDGKYTLILD